MTTTTAAMPGTPKTHLPQGITGASEQILAEAIRLLTGLPDAAPRPGQAALSREAAKAAAGGGHTAHIAPTGSGKSFGLLAPAFAAALAGRRTVIATESLSLMEQIVSKDAPVTAAAVRNIFDVEPPTVAVLKGFSNHMCNAALEETAADLWSTPKSATTFRSGPVSIPRQAAAELVTWAQSLDDDEPADAQSAPDGTPEGAWRLLSVGPGECVGTSCPYSGTCRPLAARAAAATADIVITNHSLLALQAATGSPVVSGGTLGTFQTIMVDEAHALPSWVRNQGSAQVSASTIRSIAEASSFALADPALAKDGRQVADALIRALSEVKFNEDGTAPVDADDPFLGVGALIDDWGTSLAQRLREGRDAGRGMAARRALGRLEPVRSAVGKIMREHPGTARWYASQDGQTSVNCAPVGTGGLLAANLWGLGASDADDPDAGPDQDTGTEPPGVVAVSATLQKSFVREAGLKCQVTTHPSPFAEAMSDSALLIPKLDEDEAHYIFAGGRFSVARHREWAKALICDLVDANGGSALILAASAASGKVYAQALRSALPRMRVTSQWDGIGPARLVAGWRADTAGVLVGTRSLMTGVDAKGDTCSLVIIDRPSRAAANPVDDARAEATGMEKWAAADVIYGGDAALLLAQSAGRLIRTATDTGMVALLDPRMLKSSPTTYKAPVRKLYMDAVSGFGQVFTGQDDALDWLEQARESRG